MSLLSLQDVSRKLSVPAEVLEDLIRRRILTPYGGRARLGEPRFDDEAIPSIREKIELLLPQN